MERMVGCSVNNVSSVDPDMTIYIPWTMYSTSLFKVCFDICAWSAMWFRVTTLWSATYIILAAKWRPKLSANRADNYKVSVGLFQMRNTSPVVLRVSRHECSSSSVLDLTKLYAPLTLTVKTFAQRIEATQRSHTSLWCVVEPQCSALFVQVHLMILVQTAPEIPVDDDNDMG